MSFDIEFSYTERTDKVTVLAKTPLGKKVMRDPHTTYQPTDLEWRCPGCGKSADENFIVDNDYPDHQCGDPECAKLHKADCLVCDCGLIISGRQFSTYLMKKNSLVPCPCCKGSGMIKKGTLPA